MMGCRGTAAGFFTAMMVALAGCSSMPAEERANSRDPYEDANRKVFAFNMGVDSYAGCLKLPQHRFRRL